MCVAIRAGSQPNCLYPPARQWDAPDTSMVESRTHLHARPLAWATYHHEENGRSPAPGLSTFHGTGVTSAN